jgi:hypothetical protein
MFWTEEDIQPVVDAATKMFGSQGMYYYYPSNVCMLTVSSPKFGKIWHGEVEKTQQQVAEMVAALSQATNERLQFEVSEIIRTTT